MSAAAVLDAILNAGFVLVLAVLFVVALTRAAEGRKNYAGVSAALGLGTVASALYFVFVVLGVGA